MKYVASTNKLNFDKEWLDDFLSKAGKPDECWQWHGAVQKPHNNQLPYGITRVKYDDGTWSQANSHRVMWYIKFGVPTKRFVCHSCDNPTCWNPDHLFLSDQRNQAPQQRPKNIFRITKSLRAAVRARIEELGYHQAKTKKESNKISRKIRAEFNIQIHTFRSCLKTDKCRSDSVKCEVNGVVYRSITNASQQLNISYKLVLADPTFVRLE